MVLMSDVPAKDPAVDSKKTAFPTVSRCLPNGAMVELLYRPSVHATAFALWREGSWTIEREVESEVGERLVPFSPNNNIIKNEVVLLPSEPAEYGSKEELIDQIRQFLHRYLDVSEGFEQIAAHYVLFSWVYDALNEVPYVRFQGDFGTGKTRALLVVGSLCYKPFFASGASTVSPLFHILDAFRGTLVLDEADFRFSDEKAEIVKILNNGNVQGMPVLRTMINRQREFNPRAFQVFGPKIVAMRGSYDDRALESRFLTEVMGTAPLRAGIPISLPARLKEEALGLRNKLLLFRFRNRYEIRPDAEAPLSAVSPRINQILMPLLRVVEDAKARDAIVSAATAAHMSIVAERGISTEAQLLEIIRELACEAHKVSVPIQDIADRFSTRFGVDYERAITSRWIGGMLRRRLHLAPYKSHGRYVLSVADQTKLETLYDRYGLTSEDAEAFEPWKSEGGDGDMGTTLEQ
jgi:hypothetical protein